MDWLGLAIVAACILSAGALVWYIVKNPDRLNL